jgi:hypothetical protein
LMDDHDSWMLASLILLSISSAVFLIQRFYFTFLDPIFELCIFHLPTLISVLIFLRIRMAGGEKPG